jgi:glycosyltransferase involved in cell wall biosynthesis
MVTRLFPSRRLRWLGPFCAERARALARRAEVRVIVPTPYCPPGLRFGKWKQWAEVEREGLTDEGISVSYPRFGVIPKAATWLQGVTLARSVAREYRRRHRTWRPDVVDGHFAFPDGYAAVRLARLLGCASLVTCHGSDLRKYPRIPVAGGMLRWTLRSATRVIAVSPALRRRSVELGCPEGRSLFLANGVDTGRFGLRDRRRCRERLDLPLDARIALCVGHLDDNKNQLTLIRTLAEAPDDALHLALVGHGPRLGRLHAEVRRLGLSGRVHFAGSQPYEMMPWWMGAADWLVLASREEGWPTVYFEALASGRPVITSDVPAAKECVRDERYGLIVSPNTPSAFASALRQAGERQFDAGAIRAYAEQHSWDAVAEELLEVIDSIAEGGGA